MPNLSLPFPRLNSAAVRRSALLMLFFLAASASAVPFPLNLNPRPAQPVQLEVPALAPCPPPTNPTERALWDAAAPSERPLACHNRYGGHFRFPPTPEDPSFEVLAREIAAARGEVMLANLDWEIHPDSPVHTILRGVADLYARVKASPAAYPQGMQVMLETGAIPTQLKRPDGMDQPVAMAQALAALGVPLRDDSLHWQVRLNAWRGYPHSHVKFSLIDGRSISSGGYNFTRWFNPFTPNLTSSDAGWGMGVVDERMTLDGPVALAGVWAFDDLWRQGQELSCTPQGCRVVPGVAGPHPDYAALNGPWPAGEAGYSFSLYERPGVLDAQRSLLALMNAASQTIDLDQASFSAAMLCTFANRWPEGCGVFSWPAYLRALRAAMQRGVKVRVLLNRADGELSGNMAAAALLVQQSRLDKVADRLEVRWHPDPVRSHYKVVLVDEKLPGAVMVTGSINYHFSSWGPWTLAEQSLATSNPKAVQEAQRYFDEQWAKSEPAEDLPWMTPLHP